PRKPRPGGVQRGSRCGAEIWRYSAVPRDTALRTKGTGVRGAVRSNMGGLMTSPSNVNFSGADSYLQAAMSGLAARQRTIANNIANADTPNFKASEVRFEDALKSAISRGQGSSAADQSSLNRSISRSSLIDPAPWRARWSRAV